MSTRGIKQQVRYYLYGLGEFGFTFFLLFIGYQLLYFLTDVLAWPPMLAATVYAVIQWFESTTSVLMGFFVDRMSLKWGKFRPWMIVGSIGCALFTLLFFIKYNCDLWLQIGLFCLFYLLAYTSYNLMWVSYRSMVGAASMTAEDNVSYTACSAQLGGCASLIYGACGTSLLFAFRNIERGYAFCAAICGVLMIGGMLISARATKQFDNSKTQAISATRRDQGIKLADVKNFLNKPIIVFFLASALRNSNSVLLQSLLVYYFTYVMGNAEFLSVYLMIMSITIMVGQTPANILARKFGKTKMYALSGLIAIISLMAINFINGNIVLFVIIAVINSFSNIFSGSMLPGFMNEIADYDEYMLNLSARSFIVSIGGTATKVASFVGNALAAYGLVFIGYSKGVVVDAPMASSITLLLTIGASLCVGLGTLVFLFYPLTDNIMKKVYELKEQRISHANRE